MLKFLLNRKIISLRIFCTVQLLNEKSDDDDVEARAGLKTQHELLQQLLKDEENNQEVNFYLFYDMYE